MIRLPWMVTIGGLILCLGTPLAQAQYSQSNELPYPRQQQPTAPYLGTPCEDCNTQPTYTPAPAYTRPKLFQRSNCGPTQNRVQGPTRNIVVDMPAPRVVFQQTGSTTTGCHQPNCCTLLSRLFRKKHCQYAQPTYVVSPTCVRPQQQVQVAAPQYRYVTVPVQPQVQHMQYMMVPMYPCQPYQTYPMMAPPAIGYAQPTQMRTIPQQPVAVPSPPVNPCPPQLIDYVHMKLKADELEARSSAALMSSMRESLQVQNLAMSALLGRNPGGNTAPPPATTSGYTEQLQQLESRMLQLNKMLGSLEQHKN